MRRVLVFGGTMEGRLLCESLSSWPLQVTVCVATEYGREALHGLSDTVKRHVGRLDQPAMEALMGEGFALVVDATHPYATVVSQTIQAAASSLGIPYYRLQRPESKKQAVQYVTSTEEAAAVLKGTKGNILVTTGIKELHTYAVIDAYTMRIYARVLPTVESIRRCEALGFVGSHIIAMQGPFSRELNEALICQLDIRWLVTKDGGDFGGFMAKMDATATCGVHVIVVGRPPEQDGYTMETLLARLEEMLEASK